METETDEKTDNYREYPICRTCLNVIRSRSYRLQENSGFGDALKISHILRYIVPELYLGLSHSPEICGNCRESLRVAYTFRKLCLETETMIGNYLKNVRCTAQVIDLGAVINYLSKKKVRQNAQKIISEWEDDSSEDLPSTSETPSNKKIPISDLESLKHAVQKLSQKSVKSTEKKVIESTHSRLEASHREPLKDPNEPVKDNIDPHEVTTVISKGAFPKTDLLKFDAKSGFFLNSAGRKFIIRNEKAFMINDTQDIIVADPSKSTKTYTNISPIEEKNKDVINKAAIQSNFVKLTKSTDLTNERTESPDCDDAFSIYDSDCSSIIESPPIAKSPPIEKPPPIAKSHTIAKSPEIAKSTPIANFPRIASSFSMADPIIEYPTIAESASKDESEPTALMPKLQQILTVCEETGLLKNNKGEFFNFDGTPMNNEQVEAEKNKAIIRGETLFKISNICTVTDDAFEYDSKVDQEEEIPVNLIQNPTKVTKHFGSISVKKTSDLQKPIANRTVTSVEESEQSSFDGIFPTLVKNPAHKTYERNSSTTKDTSQAGPAPPLIPISSKQSLLLNPLVNYGSQVSPDPNVQPVPVKPKPKTNILNFLMNKSLGLPEMPAIRFNMDPKMANYSPPARPEARRNYTILPKKAPDLSCHTPTFEGLMNVPSSENIDNLVRVKDEPPDFDPDNTLTPDSEETLSAPDIEELDSLQNIINSLDDTNSNYVDIPDFVKINNVNMLEIEQLHEEHYSNKNLIPSSINESQNMYDNILIKKVSSNKDEPTLKQPINAVNDRALWESLPERFPYNGKMLIKCGNYYKFEEEKKAPRKRRRIRMVPISCTPVPPQPQQEEEVFPDREICVLFTNYSSDGLYINDHDYLVAPYVRNKLIVHEKKDTYCICFICGFKHRMQNHADHMKVHSSTCSVCYVDLRTPYMLNLHMKSHAEPCDICLGIVPYVNITKHNNMHYKGYCGKESIFELDDCEADEEEEEENIEIFEEANRLVKPCYVPSCKNNSKNSSKIFIYIPRRKHLNWFKAVGRNTLPARQNLFWCCEDHFDMKNDFENWQEYKLLNTKLRIKKDVIPHKFTDTPSTLDKHYSQLDDESRKIQEENLKKYNLEKGVKLDDRMEKLLEKETEKWMTRRLRTRLSTSNKNDPKQSKNQPSTDPSSNAKPESDESIQKSTPIAESNESVPIPPATRGRRSLRTRKSKSPNKKKKHEDSSDIITPTTESPIAKTEIDELTDTNQTFSEETKNSSFEKSTENFVVQKSENENTPAIEKSRKVRKRASREVECPNEAELSTKRILRTRVKKSDIVNENNESDLTMPIKSPEQSQEGRKEKNIQKVKKVAKTAAQLKREYRARVKAREIAAAAKFANNVESIAIQTASQHNLEDNQVEMRGNQDLPLSSETPSTSAVQMQSNTQNVTTQKRNSKKAQTSAERVRAYRARKKGKVSAGALRNRKYRARIKARENAAAAAFANNVESIAIQTASQPNLEDKQVEMRENQEDLPLSAETPSTSAMQIQSSTQNVTTRKGNSRKAKTSAELIRAYRGRKKGKISAGALRKRKYRARKKAVAAASANNVESIAIQTASQLNLEDNQVEMRGNQEDLLLSSDTPSTSDVQMQSSTINKTARRRNSRKAKTSAERVREYRERKKALQNTNNQQLMADATHSHVDDIDVLQELPHETINAGTSTACNQECTVQKPLNEDAKELQSTSGSLNNKEYNDNVINRETSPTNQQFRITRQNPTTSATSCVTSSIDDNNTNDIQTADSRVPYSE